MRYHVTTTVDVTDIIGTLQLGKIEAARLGLLPPDNVETALQIILGNASRLNGAWGVSYVDIAAKSEAEPADGSTTHTLSDREHATVLAALRYWQAAGANGDLRYNDEMIDIATNGGTVTECTDEDVDALCERLNCGDEPAEEAASMVGGVYIHNAALEG
jgi:hypothetical protein